MAFFDNLSRMASEASQKAVQKTKDFSDTTKLNTTITEAEKNISVLYEKLGKLYMQVHRDNPEQAFEKLVKEIISEEEKIVESRKEIQKIKGVRKCPECGAEVSLGAAFCSSCGGKMPSIDESVAVADEFVQCENCGSFEKPGLRFCTNCGSKMKEEPVISENLEDAEALDTKTCTACGAKIAKELAFCTECGKKFE